MYPNNVLLTIFVNELTSSGKHINPKGNMKKGGNNNAVVTPKIKNLNKIN